MQTKTNKMDCTFVRSNLFSYEEQQLSAKERIEFENHLHSCAECSRIVSEFHTVISIIEKKKSDEPNPFMQTRTIQQIESQLEGEQEHSIPVFQRILRPLSFSFMLLVAMLIGFSLIKQRHEGFVDVNRHQNSIQAMKSELNIPDFIDEDNTFFDNH